MEKRSSNYLSGTEKHAGRIIRKRRRNRRMIKFATALVIVLGIGLATGGIFSYAGSKTAGSDPSAKTYKYYTSIQIQHGDTLHSIAKNHISKEYKDISSYMNEVIQMNTLKDEVIHEGQYLIIPYYQTVE